MVSSAKIFYEHLPVITLFSCSVHCVKLVLMVSQDVSTALRDMRETFVEGEELCQAVYLSF